MQRAIRARERTRIMASLLELVDRVNKGEIIDSEQLEVYQESPNSAEKFLAHHAQAMLDLRRAQQHMLQSLEAIDYSDQKVLNQFIGVSSFLGQGDMRAGPVIKFGAMAINRREYALGLEAIQNGVSYDLAQAGSFTQDKENCQFIASQYERAAQCIGWTGGQEQAWNNKEMRIAVIVSAIADDEASGKMVRSLARNHDSKRMKLCVFSTEASVRRDRQQFAQSSYTAPSAKRGGRTLDVLAKQKVSTWTASTEGDTVTAARELADQLVRERIDVAIIDATQADPIAALIASWDTAAVKINLCRRTPLYCGQVSCITYVDQERFERERDFWQRRGIESSYILEGVDLDETIGQAPRRSAYGVPEQSVVLATVSGDLDRTLSEHFVETIIKILRANPNAIYLAIGDGELAWQKKKFESAGAGKRVGYAGRRRDLPGFLRIADAYLAEFPDSEARGVLEAMAVERPVVAMKWGDEAAQCQAATLIGAEAAIVGRDTAAYIERVNKIIREPAFRQRLGKSMRARVEQHFGFAQTARHLEQLCEQLIQRRQEQAASAGRIDQDQSNTPLAAVA
jgi:hypothetical protein